MMRTNRHRRGIALLTVLLIVVVLLILIGALLDFMPVELNQAAYVGYDNRSLYAADAGVQYAAEKIEEDAANGVVPTPAPTPGGKPYVQFSLDPSPSPSASPDVSVYIQAVGPTTGQATYYVTSIGTVGGLSHRVDAVLQEEPLNSDLLLGKNNAPGNYFVSGLMYFDGPVYLEGATHPINIQWYNNVTPVFGDTAQISGNYKWYGPTKTGVPGNAAQWADVDAKGQGGMTFSGPDAVSYPALTDSAAVANEAFSGTQGGTTIPSPAKGVYMDGAAAIGGSGATSTCNGLPQVDSGIFVQGDADIAMTSTPTTQTFLFSPSGTAASFSPLDTLTVTIDFSADTTTAKQTDPLTNQSTSTVYCGTPSGDTQGPSTANGVIFVDGDVDALAGTVHGDYTVAVPDDTTSGTGANNVVLTGNITLQNDPDPANPGYCNCQSTDMLGIYAHDVLVSQKFIPGAAQFEAAIFAGNQADVAANNPDGAYMVQGPFTGGARGTLNVFGSVVQNYVQPLGVFNPGTGKLVRDWADTYNWDRRFLNRVPPGMPQSDRYAPIAWKDVGTP